MRRASAIALVLWGCWAAAPVAGGEAPYEIVKAFNNIGSPQGEVIQASDGALYGTTFQGGDYGMGTVFRLSADGSSLSVLRSFSGNDGANPSAALVEGSDGDLYGTTTAGGSSNFGTVFKISTDGSAFSRLHSFDAYSYPRSPLIQGGDGAFYGVTYYGGAQGRGSLFKISSSGSSFATLHSFDDSSGSLPAGRLAEDPQGNFYGTLYSGAGGFSNGAVFKVSADGSSSSLLHVFDGSDGRQPFAGVIRGSDGAFYGTTGATVFRVSADGSFSVLHTFGFGDGWGPDSPLLQGSDGALYGTTRSGGALQGGTVFRVSIDGSSFSTLHAFDGLSASYPVAGLIQGADGALYGTTAGNGEGQWASRLDVVYRLSTDGSSYSILRRLGTVEGAYPDAGLIQGQDGAFYGTTAGGGEKGNFGTVFRVSADGVSHSVLHSFDRTHGAYPYADLLQGADGALYGTTSSGGSFFSGLGVVFKVDPDGANFAVLHDFSGPEGAFPYAILIQGTDGALYGTTAGGGARFYGTVFKLNPDGTAFQVLHDFDLLQGAYPYAGVIQGSDGNLYGTTAGDQKGRGGTVFKLSPDGSSFAVLHKFVKARGLDSEARLLQGADGALYGTTYRGGASDLGTLFRISTDGSSFEVLHDFNGYDGANPIAGLLQGSDGVLYGTTVGGGAHLYYGTAFRLTPDGSHFEVIHNFDYESGGYVYAGLVQGSDDLYGATDSGGPLSAGTIFRLTPGPTAFPRSVSVVMGSPTPIPVWATSLPGGMLTYSVVSGPAHGSLTGTAPDLVYTPAPGYSGPDSFSFAATDDSGNDSNAAPVSIAVVKGIQFSKPLFTGKEPGNAVVVSVTAQVAESSTVDVVTSDGTAKAGVDYVATTTPLSFAPGTSTRTVSIPLVRNTVYDGDESFLVTLKNASGTGLGVQRTAVVTITDKNPAPAFQFSSASYPATQGGPLAQITVVRRGLALAPASVDFTTSDGTGTVADGDYTATSGTLTFGVGVTTASFPVTIGNGSVAKPTTVVNLELKNPSAGSILGPNNRATINIKSTRQALQWSAAGYTSSEGAPQAILMVKRTGSSAGTVSVDYADAGTGTATAGADYSLVPGTLTFGPGVVLQKLTVDLLSDSANEGSETVRIELGNPSGATILGPNPATLTILDTLPTVQFSASAYAALEPLGTGLRKALVTVRRTGSLLQTAHVDYATSPGSAVRDVDYKDTSGTLTFGAGVASQTFTVDILGNTVVNPGATIKLELTTVDIPLGTPSQAVITVKDNDVAGTVQLSASAYSGAAPGSIAVTVARSGGIAGPATLHYATADGTATAGVDYTPAADTLTFAAGETSKTVLVDVSASGGANKYLRLSLDTPTGGLKLGPQSSALLWIVE